MERPKIQLETTSSYDENKYESLGVVNAAMAVTVSFTVAPPPAKATFFGSAPKAAPPVDKQQRLTSTENQMLKALKNQLIMNAPPGTQRLIDFKISPPENIAHSPEYIISMLASATAIRKAAAPQEAPPAPEVAPMSPQLPQMPGQSQPMSQPLAPMSQPMSQPLAHLPLMSGQSQPMSQPFTNFQRQMGGKRRNAKNKRKQTLKKKRSASKTRKHPK